MRDRTDIAAGSDVVITDIGEGADKALRCVTDQIDCCNSQFGMRRGEWMLPDGSLVGIPNDGGDFYRNRSFQEVFLHRRNNAMGPLGSYCCDLDTVADLNATACINMSKHND